MAPSPTHTVNGLLAALPRRELLRLKPFLERVPLRLKTMLSVSGQSIEYAYFPEAGLISLVQPLAEGNSIEVGLVGREGFFGVPLVHGANASPIEAMVQGDGVALRIHAKHLVAETERSALLRRDLLRYAEALHLQTAQIAACNARHSVRERLSRWLLHADDCMQPNGLNFSHEFLAMMLGMRRAGVTSVLGELRRKRMIVTGTRSVRLRDRKAMEAATCECYAAAKAETAKLLRKGTP